LGAVDDSGEVGAGLAVEVVGDGFGVELEVAGVVRECAGGEAVGLGGLAS